MALLLSYPRVRADEERVFVEYSDGRRMLWGEEESEAEAKVVAEVLELELKVFEYIRVNVDESLSALHGALGSIASEDLVDEFIHEVLLQKVRANYLQVK